jgi:hypothetical protein
MAGGFTLPVKDVQFIRMFPVLDPLGGTAYAVPTKFGATATPGAPAQLLAPPFPLFRNVMDAQPSTLTQLWAIPAELARRETTIKLKKERRIVGRSMGIATKFDAFL